MPGAQVSITSRSGSNEFHGSLLYSFRHEALTANDWFASRHGDPQGPLHLNDFSAGLGGPVWRDKTFFFVAFEALRLRQPFAWISPVPSERFRQAAPDWVKPVLPSFPAGNVEGPRAGLPA